MKYISLITSNIIVLNLLKFQIVFMSITIAPVRLVSLALLFGLAWLLAAISLAYRTPEEKKKPLEGWRK